MADLLSREGLELEAIVLEKRFAVIGGVQT